MARGPRVAPYARVMWIGAVAAAVGAAAAGVSGCGHEGAYDVAGTGSARPSAPTMAQVRTDLKRMGYDLYGPTELPPGPLRAFRGIWHEAGDGGVQNVFFYHGDHFAGVAHDPNFRSAVISAQDGRSVTVKQYRYRTDDPNCCPSGGTRAYTFTWSGGRLVARAAGAAHPAPTAPPATPVAS